MAGKLLVIAAILALIQLPYPALGRQKSWLATIKEINRNGPYLGLITVYSAEEDAFFAAGAFKNNSKYPHVDLSGRRFRVGRIEGKKVIYVKCGVGMVNAAAATQQMLDLFRINGVIHFGVSGNTNSSMSIGDVIIPKAFVNTGLWNWMKPNATVPADTKAELDVEDYNMPKRKRGINSLGRIAYRAECVYSDSEAGTPKKKLWFYVTTTWLDLATKLEGIQLEQCANSSLCLETRPKLVVGLRGSTSNIFLNNGDYRDFLFQTFGVSSTDMESSAVVMTSFSNGYPVIVFRGLSDLAGAQTGETDFYLFQTLASSNVATAVIQFIKLLSKT